MDMQSQGANLLRPARSARLAVGLLAVLAIATCCRPAQAAELASPDSLQRAVTAGRGERFELAAGVMPVKQSLRWPMVAGGVLQGRGVAEPIEDGHPLLTSVTRLVWAGARPTAEPMFVYEGAGLAIRDVCLDGGTKQQIVAGAPRGGVGLLVTQPGDSLGVGNITADNVAMSYWDTAIRLAQRPDEHNCELSSWRHVRFNRCKVGVRIVSMQALGHHFDAPEFTQVETAFRIEGGGKFSVRDPFFLSPGTVLEFAPPTDVTIGINNAFYMVRDLIADQQADDLALVRMAPGKAYFADIVFDGGRISDEQYARPACEIAGYTSLTLRDFCGVQPKWFRWNNPPGVVCRIYLENCRLLRAKRATELFDVAGSRGQCRVIVRDCFDETAGAAINYTAVLTGAAE
jgi:hypothetical protein